MAQRTETLRKMQPRVCVYFSLNLLFRVDLRWLPSWGCRPAGSVCTARRAGRRRASPGCLEVIRPDWGRWGGVPGQPWHAQPSRGSRKLRGAQWDSEDRWVGGHMRWWGLARWACFASGSTLCPAERSVQAGFYVSSCDHVIILTLLGELLFHVTANWNLLALLGLQINLLKKQVIEISYLFAGKSLLLKAHVLSLRGFHLLVYWCRFKKISYLKILFKMENLTCK